MTKTKAGGLLLRNAKRRSNRFESSKNGDERRHRWYKENIIMCLTSERDRVT